MIRRPLALMLLAAAITVAWVAYQSALAFGATPPAAKPHVVCGVVAFLIVGPDAKPAAVLDTRLLMLVPCPSGKPAAKRGPTA